MAKDFSVDKLKGAENFHTWQFAMKSMLELKGWDKSIMTRTVPATSTTPVSTECMETDESICKKAKGMIVLTLETGIFVHVSKCTSALEIWQTLKKMYEDKGLTRKIGLLRNLIQTRLEECDNMQDFVDKIMSTANKLTGVGFEINDDWLGAILLAGLTEEFKPLIMSIEANNESISSDSIVSKLLDMQSSTAKGEAFLGKKFKKKKSFSKKRTCYICKSPQHFADKCPNKDKHKSDEKKKPKESGNAFLTVEEKPDTHAMLSRSEFSEWYVDSGGSAHMTPDDSILVDVKKSAVAEIKTASNAIVKVKCMGNSILNVNNQTIQVNDILHVPGLSANLLSVSKIVSQGNRVVFDADGCKIYNRDKEIIASCKAQNGVYKLMCKKKHLNACLRNMKRMPCCGTVVLVISITKRWKK